PLRVLHIPYTDLFGGRRAGRAPMPGGAVDAGAEPAPPAAPAPAPKAEAKAEAGAEAEQAAKPPQPGASPSPAAQPPRQEPREAAERAASIPDVALLALGSRTRHLDVPAPAGVAPYSSPGEHLSDTLELVAAWAARAIADAWDSGRLSLPNQDPRPFQREVMALVGNRLGAAVELLQQADARVEEVARRVGRRVQATLAAGRSLPLVELAVEFGLSDAAVKVLAVVAAPALRGEI